MEKGISLAWCTCVRSGQGKHAKKEDFLLETQEHKNVPFGVWLGKFWDWVHEDVIYHLQMHGNLQLRIQFREADGLLHDASGKQQLLLNTFMLNFIDTS